MHVPSDHNIKAFWDWFSDERATLQGLIESPRTSSISKVLSPRVASLSTELGWEVGPGLSKRYMFAFGLRGQLEALDVSRRIIAAAPEFADWEFHAARPPKQWDMRFTLQDQLGHSVEIDARQWKYALTAFDDCSFFDVIFVAKDAGRLDPKAREQAGAVLLQGELGEVDFLRAIDNIAIAITEDALDPNTQKRLSDVPYLRGHLLSLMKHHVA